MVCGVSWVVFTDSSIPPATTSPGDNVKGGGPLLLFFDVHIEQHHGYACDYIRRGRNVEEGLSHWHQVSFASVDVHCCYSG
jgi:hypothetical protein